MRVRKESFEMYPTKIDYDPIMKMMNVLRLQLVNLIKTAKFTTIPLNCLCKIIKETYLISHQKLRLSTYQTQAPWHQFNSIMLVSALSMSKKGIIVNI